jgi:preprotein translocase subunit SecA
MSLDAARELLGAALAKLFGSKNAKTLRRIEPVVAEVAAWEPKIAPLSDADLRAKTEEFRRRSADRAKALGLPGLRETMDRLELEGRSEQVKEVRKRCRHLSDSILEELLPEAFACAREAAKRAIGQRHYDVQVLGAVVLHQGKISEMVTGEGKTLVATMPAYLNAIARAPGRQSGVHVVTVNDYLARRDAAWMGAVYRQLGLTVGCIQVEMGSAERLEQYASDVVYGQNNEFGFDYLRDNMKISPAQQVQKERRYAIVDEVDSILIDEARTPLIISGAAEEASEFYYRANEAARGLGSANDNDLQPRIEELIREGWEKEAAKEKAEEPYDYVYSEKHHSAYLTERGREKCMRRLHAGSEQEFQLRWDHYIENALRAHSIYKRDVDYVVKEGQVLIVDEFTGRILPGRRWSDGLHQAVEAKENLKIKEENQTLATITFQNFFRLYDKLAGMTGTAMTEAKEFMQVYKIDTVAVPPNRPLRRESFPDVIYGTEKEKFDAIIDEIVDVHRTGRPVLVGTISIEKSEQLSSMLRRRGISHDVLNAKQHEREAHIVAKAGQVGHVTIATNMAGRGTDIVLGRFPKEEILDYWKETGLAPDGVEAEDPDALTRLLRHWVASFEEHMPEKKGLSAEAVEAMGPVDLEAHFERRCREFRVLPWEWGTSVADLGGLHIVGSERHEARRIDNQLRGRSGRQGDPGSSRFFLSLDDDLMRIFASEWVRNFLRKWGVSGGQPLEHGMVTRAIEKAQRRVEEHNFAIRKRLIEYDQVMNEQRTLVYGRRQEILEGKNIRERVQEMIEDTVANAVSTYVDERLPQSEWDWHGLLRWAERKFGFNRREKRADGRPAETRPELRLEREELQDRSTRGVEAKLLAKVRSVYEAREREYGQGAVRELERFVQLDVIDKKWKDHLRDMDHLKEGIWLRSYAQKDPKIEYKREGYNLFMEMMVAIYEEVTDRVLRETPIRLPAEVEQALAERWQISEEGRGDLGGFGEGTKEMAAASEHGGSEWKPVETYRREGRKIRPNEPCPCGSGKKYKRCHGRKGARAPAAKA